MLPGEPPAEVASLRMTLNSLLNHYKQRFGEVELRDFICACIDPHGDECRWCGRPFDDSALNPTVYGSYEGTAPQLIPPSAPRRTFQ